MKNVKFLKRFLIFIVFDKIKRGPLMQLNQIEMFLFACLQGKFYKNNNFSGGKSLLF